MLHDERQASLSTEEAMADAFSDDSFKRSSLSAPAKKPKPDIFSAADLMETDFPEPIWSIQGVLPSGLAIIAGSPKLGKSWLCLSIADAVSGGIDTLGLGACAKGEVLYLALEDTKRRLKDRLKTLGCHPSNDLSLATEWRRMHEGGLDDLKRWCTEHQDAKLIIIDTFQKIRPPSAKSSYGDDYKHIGDLKQIADHFTLTVLVVHHLRKMADDTDPLNEISGSTGITGAADTLMVLKRGRGKADAALSVTGRDIQEREIALKFDNGQWCNIGEPAELNLSENQRQIIQAIELHGSITPSEINKITGINPNTVKSTVTRLAKSGLLHSDQGKYSIPATHATVETDAIIEPLATKLTAGFTVAPVAVVRTKKLKGENHDRQTIKP